MPDDPQLVEDLVLYFPKQLRQTFRPAIERHRLRREIIASFITNTLVNRVGPTFVWQIMEETGKPASDVARAYAIIRDSIELRTIHKGIEKLDYRVSPAAKSRMMIEVGKLIERTMLWLLRSGYEKLDIAAHVAELRPRIAALSEQIDQTLPPSALGVLQARASEYAQIGIPEALGRRLTSVEVLGSGMDIVKIARAGRVGADSPWQKTAVAALVEDLYSYQSLLTARALGEQMGADPLEAWLAARRALVARVDGLLSELRAASSFDLAMMTVASRQLRALVES